MIALLVITDGRRDCVERTIQSAAENLDGPISRRVLFDDSGDQDHHRWLQARFPDFEVHWHYAGRQGFGGAIRAAWKHIAAGDQRWVFHLEDDFTFNRPVDLTDMATVLALEPKLVQLALRRQPWNDEERTAGGIVESHPEDFKDCQVGPFKWLEHRRFLTTNPCLYRRSLCSVRWPEGPNSEGMMTHKLLSLGPDIRFGYWGSRDSGEWVTHIGDNRVGTGY